MKWLMLFAFGGLGTALAVGGTWWAGNRYLVMEDGIFVTGQVVGHEESQASGSTGRRKRTAADGTFYSPIVVFRTEDGDAHRVVAVEKATSAADSRVVLVCRALQPGTSLARQYRSHPVSVPGGATLIGARIELDVHPHDPSKYRVLADTLATPHGETA